MDDDIGILIMQGFRAVLTFRKQYLARGKQWNVTSMVEVPGLILGLTKELSLHVLPSSLYCR